MTSGFAYMSHVALAVADLRIGEAVPLLGRRSDRLRVHLEAGRPDADLAGLGAPDRAFGDDDVAVVERLRQSELRLDRHVALREGHLEVAARVAQTHEDELADVAMLDDAAADLRPPSRVDDRRRRVRLAGRLRRSRRPRCPPH
jgi:hypothetical protein